MNLNLFLKNGRVSKSKIIYVRNKNVGDYKNEIIYKTNKNDGVQKFSTLFIYKKFILVFFLIIISIIILENSFPQKIQIDEKKLLFNNSSFNITFKHNSEIKLFILDISCKETIFNLKFNVCETIYYIHVYDKNNNLIHPFDLTFYYNLHLFCFMKIINDKNEIETLPNFNNNSNFICIEQFEPTEKVELGIRIYQKSPDYKLIYFFVYFSTSNSSFSLFNEKIDDKLSPLIIQNEYKYLVKEINKNNTKLSLKASYVKQPSFILKTDKKNIENRWLFKNIYNHYFCFCKGIDCKKNSSNFIFQNCKYFYYLSIIDQNRNLYEKTEYLLADFIGSNFNADDTFPIFKQMIKQNISAHYMTAKNEIYKEYCPYNKKCWTIIKEDFINGDFLEKYIELILKLKVTVAGADFPSINNLFYNIEYITSINIGHGVKFFKSFLYKDYTSPNKYNKLVLASSNKIISIAKRYGWKDENIIKICLPKWDKYNSILNITTNKERSIFIFFTFRERKKTELKKEKMALKISQLYINNILLLLNDTKLNYELKKQNITLLFGLHHNLRVVKDYIAKNFDFVKIIRNKLISECLMKSSLMVTDFSSVTFDFIYQRKPVIIYIPDYKDPKIKDLYSENYYNLIKNMGNGTIYFENKFNEIKDVVDKIIFYLKTDFKLDSKLERFYNSFEFKCKKNNIQAFIDYIKNIK